ncbi:MAG: discoidin domain-containing protein [Phycisphaerales bacterium]
MSNLKCFLVALTLVCACSNASAGVLYFEDFESFNAGVVLHEVADWEGWYGDAGAAAIVSDKFAYSGAKSVEVDSSADAVHLFDIAEGKWVLTVMQYIPSGTSGITRFHMQNTYGDSIGRSVQWSFSLSDGVIGDDYDADASARIIYDQWIQLKLVIDLDNDHLDQYYNGVLFSSRAWVFSGSSKIRTIDLYGNGASSVYYDDIKVQDYLSSLVTAYDPSPEDGATDVPRDVALAWTSGRLADTHDVYFGTTFADVDEAGRDDARNVLVSQDQETAEYDPEGLLQYSQTYYWRIDEVNAASDPAISKGNIWTFTTEPYAYPILGVKARASNEQTASPAIRTVDGSGLDEFDQHGTDVKTMWVGNLPAWIQYTFDQEYKLHELWVWNANSEIEAFMGFGAKDVTIEYSADGTTWAQLQNVPQFTQGAGTTTYTANTVVSFGGVAAKYVRLTINAAYGATGIIGLSEVRFFYVPTQAFGPDPTNGATGISVEAELNWRPGREATSHTVYIDVDEAVVAGGTSAVHTTTDHRYVPASLDVATVYFWRVDETGDAGTYAGDVWSFTTEEFAAVDDFESYNDSDRCLYDTWIDGVTNGSGSYVGYQTSKNGTFGETVVVHAGSQSMPVTYDNTKSPYYSEVERTFGSSQDWTAHGADTLSLYFRDVTTNSPEPLYVTVKDNSKSATVAHSNAAATTVAEWQQWKIPLSEFTSAGVKVTAVKALVIGVGNRAVPAAGGTGIVYIDDIGYGRPLQ